MWQKPRPVAMPQWTPNTNKRGPPERTPYTKHWNMITSQLELTPLRYEAETDDHNTINTCITERDQQGKVHKQMEPTNSYRHNDKNTHSYKPRQTQTQVIAPRREQRPIATTKTTTKNWSTEGSNKQVKHKKKYRICELRRRQARHRLLT